MKHLAVITDTSPQFGGETSIICYSRADAIIKARKECLDARSFGIKCYAKVLPKKRNGTIISEFKNMGWIS